MSFTVLTSPDEYAELLRDMETSSAGPNSLAASFVSSVYFSEAAIRRFYLWSNLPSHQRASEYLLQRRRIAHSRKGDVRRREIYEAEAFVKLLSEGTAHTQEPAYRSRPSEIRDALQTMLHWIREEGTLEVAITTEVLPVVFALYAPATVVMDIRTNYLYQRIQGFLVRDDAPACEVFQREFNRLWGDATAERSPSYVPSLIEKSLSQWGSGAPIDYSVWPKMRKSDRT